MGEMFALLGHAPPMRIPSMLYSKNNTLCDAWRYDWVQQMALQFGPPPKGKGGYRNSHKSEGGGEGKCHSQREITLSHRAQK